MLLWKGGKNWKSTHVIKNVTMSNQWHDQNRNIKKSPHEKKRTLLPSHDGQSKHVEESGTSQHGGRDHTSRGSSSPKTDQKSH